MKIGLALSGGGVRGVAHAGVIKALQEHGILINQISGTSAGALVGALYAKGIEMEEIFHFFEKSTLFDPRKIAFKQAGFIKSSVFTEHLASYIPENSFDSLEIPLRVTATNLYAGKLKIFTEGELYLPILASAAFPGIFTPVEIEGNTYVDGGVLNNFPINLLEDCDIKIGSYVNKVDLTVQKLKHSYDVAGRAYTINQYQQDKIKFSQCDLLIEPDLFNYGLFSFNAMKDIFQIGYETASQGLKNSTIFDY
ncbi:patatin-like phospholipase family protein [Nonlabens sp.]|uniref:patatin-like phospholipase family protein n=1 Tax=Nonlabens sp. TaxID=1888209 RepID=UPI0025F2D77F|nr:patatin-like phospholipase family protein [Nonlabens sp.]